MKRETYKKIIGAAGINTGDLVLIQYWMNDTFSEDIGFLQAEIAAAGATPVMVVQNLGISQLVNENATENTYGDKFFKLYEDADVVIDFMERPIGVLSKALEPDKMGILGAYMGRLFETCSSKKKMLQLRVPTEVMASREGLEPEDYKTRMESAMDIDYNSLRQECEKVKETNSCFSGITIKTGNECCLDISFGDRTWDIDAGDGDIPCGEVNIAPIENKTNGEVFFEKIYLPDPAKPRIKHDFENVVLYINNGIITSSNNNELDALLEMYGPENSTICELGFGLNPGVTSLCGCAVLDEKMTGTFHLGIGDNTMFGGTNESDFHNDLIGRGEYIWKE